MGNVIDLKTRKVLLGLSKEDYHGFVSSIGRLSLLEEFLRYQKEVREGQSIETIEKGLILFKELVIKCETPQMIDFASMYMRHLELERKRFA